MIAVAPDPASSARFTGETPVLLTLFRDVKAQTKTEVTWLAGHLVDQITAVSAGTKAELPLLKLARFGEKGSARGSPRTDSNVTAITGIEVEYDGGEIGFDAALRILREAGLGAIVYTSPSHTPDKPRWRILLFCSRDLPPAERRKLVTRVNGLLGGILSRESFALSQPYYYGYRRTNADNHRVELIEGDFIDLRPDLDIGAIDSTSLAKTAASSVDKAKLEAHFKRQVDWFVVGQCADPMSFEAAQPGLFERLQGDLNRGGNLARRWKGGVDGLTDTSRSGRDRSIVQILRTKEYTITEAIACAVAWGGDDADLGRGSDASDKHGNEIDWQRYWVRCWMRPDDQVPVSWNQLPSQPSVAPPIEATNPFPEICRRPPGMVGELVDLLARGSARDLREEILVPLALTMLAFCSQNRFAAGSDKLKTALQLYVIVVAKTGVGKTDFIKLLSTSLEGSKVRERIVEAFASGPALLRRFHKIDPNSPYGPTLLFIADEIGLKLQARQSRSGQSHVKDLVDEVIALYGRATTVYGGKGYADVRQDIEPIKGPNLNLVGFTTEAPLMEALTMGDAASGFANRFILADVTDADAPLKRLDEIDQTIPKDLAKFLQSIGSPSLRFPQPVIAPAEPPPLITALQAMTGKGDQVLLPFDDAAVKFLEELRVKVNKETKGADGLTTSVWARSWQQVRIIAGILAIGEIDINAPTVPPITRAHLEWAWAFVCWSNQNWLNVFGGKISSNDEEAAMNELRALLARVSDYAPGGRLSHKADYGNSKNNSAITARGWMPLSLFGRELRGISTDLRGKALAALVENEEVEMMKTENPEGSKKATISYRLATPS